MPSLYLVISGQSELQEPLISQPAIIIRSYHGAKTCVQQETSGQRHVIIYRSGNHAQAYWFHSYCWQLLKKIGANIITSSKLMNFAQSTAAIFNPSNGSYPSLQQLLNGAHSLITKYLTERRSSETDLFKLLEKVLELPVEIVGMILTLTRPCAILSLLIIEAGVALSLLKRVLSKPLSLVEFKLEDMSFGLITIRGEEYLCNSKQVVSQPCKTGIPPLHSIFSIKVTIGPYGIRLLQFQQDDVLSVSIGEAAQSADGWTAIVRSQNIKNLTFRHDVRKLNAP